jgi:hypothetical protein
MVRPSTPPGRLRFALSQQNSKSARRPKRWFHTRPCPSGPFFMVEFKNPAKGLIVVVRPPDPGDSLCLWGGNLAAPPPPTRMTRYTKWRGQLSDSRAAPLSGSLLATRSCALTALVKVIIELAIR